MWGRGGGLGEINNCFTDYQLLTAISDAWRIPILLPLEDNFTRLKIRWAKEIRCNIQTVDRNPRQTIVSFCHLVKKSITLHDNLRRTLRWCRTIVFYLKHCQIDTTVKSFGGGLIKDHHKRF